MTETRNEFGFPVLPKLERAKEIAAAAKARNTPACDCATCRQIDLLPAVQRITQNWRTK